MKPTDEQVAQAWWEVWQRALFFELRDKQILTSLPEHLTWERLATHSRTAYTNAAHVMRELIVDTDAGEILDGWRVEVDELRERLLKRPLGHSDWRSTRNTK